MFISMSMVVNWSDGANAVCSTMSSGRCSSRAFLPQNLSQGSNVVWYVGGSSAKINKPRHVYCSNLGILVSI